MSSHSSDLPGRTFLVTGANTGIGRATAADLAGRGGKVFVACRSAEKGHAPSPHMQREVPVIMVASPVWSTAVRDRAGDLLLAGLDPYLRGDAATAAAEAGPTGRRPPRLGGDPAAGSPPWAGLRR